MVRQKGVGWVDDGVHFLLGDVFFNENNVDLFLDFDGVVSLPLDALQILRWYGRLQGLRLFTTLNVRFLITLNEAASQAA